MGRSKNPVWVFSEQKDGKIPDICYELLGKARKLADDLHVNLEAILLGQTSQEQLDALFHSGADTVYYGDSPKFDGFQTELFSETILKISEDKQPQIILFGSTFLGRELAPIAAAKLGTGITAHCIDLIINEENILEQWIPAYGGLISITCPNNRPQIATVARGVFQHPDLDQNRSGKIITIHPPINFTPLVKTLDVVTKDQEGVPLEDALTIVAGGAGAETLEGWKEIQELAEVLNAALGSTRPAVDEGWTDLESMIGQSGKMVSPDLYIGVGLSGEQQHMVGISGAKIMVAINNDPKSPVFEQVDIGIVEDCRAFIPVFVKKLEESRNRLK
jgi:electron transfer flavoprotein alpha subunit